MRVESMSRTSGFLILVGLGFWMPAAAAESRVNGRLGEIETIRVLWVWGTPQEMGFAHGHLLADDIVTALEEMIGNPDPQAYAERLKFVQRITEISPDTLAELEGIIAGISKKKGELPVLNASGKPVQLADLIALNAGDLTRAFACSGFTVWGEQAGPAGVITARNFDFAVITRYFLSPGLILVRAPAGRHAVATVTMPGYIGVITGVNQNGVCAFIHDGNGPKSQTPDGTYTPLALALKEFVENATAVDALPRAEQILRKISPYPFSYMARIVAPRTPERDAPARVFRIDAEGFGINGQDRSNCITTNHYIGGDDPPPGNSQLRFETIREKLGGQVTSEIAWKALDAVSAAEPMCTTVHSLVVYPELAKLEIAFADAAPGIRPATKSRPVTIAFDQLFAGGTAGAVLDYEPKTGH